MPDQKRPAEELRGYFRLNQEGVLRAARRKGLENTSQIARALHGVVGEASFFRAFHDRNIPTSRMLFALTELLDAKVEELFDPVLIPLDKRTSLASRSE